MSVLPGALQRYWNKTGYTNADVVNVTLNEKNHQYWATMKDGKKLRLKSVTSILGVINKPALVFWSANEAGAYIKENLQPGEQVSEERIHALVEGARKAHTVKRDKAAELGTQAHNLIERFLKGEDVDAAVENADIQVRNAVHLFWDWWETEQLAVLCTEPIVFDVALGFAGKLDCLVVKPDGTIWLLDWKTGKAIYAEMQLQVVAYLHLLLRSLTHYPQLAGRNVSALGIVRTGKEEAEFETADIPASEWEELFWIFQATHMLCDWHANEEAKREAAKRVAKKGGRVNAILFDLESQSGPDDHPGKWNDKHKFGVSCAGLYDLADKRVKLYWGEHPEEMADFAARLASADYVIGFWHTMFDLACLAGHLVNLGIDPPQPKNNVDLRIVVGNAINTENMFNGRRLQSKGNNLQALLTANKLTLKSDHGANAPGLFQARSIGKLLTYQADDIRAEYGLLRHLAIKEHLVLACGASIPCKLPEPFRSEYRAWLGPAAVAA